MLAAEFLGFDPSSWEFWAVPASGVLAASTLLLVGVLVGRRARRRSEEEARSFHSAFHGSVVDRRQWPRRKGNRVAVLVTEGQAAAHPSEAWVLDRSEGGICLVVDAPLDVGVGLSVRPAQAAEAVPWLAVEVRSCRPTTGGWALGCRFVQPPPLHVLLLFG
jgi:hypothetical protein